MSGKPIIPIPYRLYNCLSELANYLVLPPASHDFEYPLGEVIRLWARHRVSVQVDQVSMSSV